MVHFPAQPPQYIRALGLEPSAHSGPLRGHQKAQTSMLSAQWRSQQPVGCGLHNLGNSCYLNSILQCLAHLPPFANIALAKEREEHCKCASGKCVCCVIDRQVRNMLQHRGSGAVAPSLIHNNLHVLSRSFVRGRQEDAHELLRCLVDAMERAALRQAGNFNPQKPPRQPRTLVNHIFGGILQSQVRCLSCSHISATWDPCMDLSLELGGCSTVEDALRRFTAVERLDGDNKYRCDGCKQLVAANKHMNIYDDPNVLVIHLKRFDGIFGAKISRDIAFDMQLDLEPFICPSRRFKPNGGSSSSSSCANGASSSSSSSTWLNGCAGSNGSTGNHCGNGSSVYSNGNCSHCANGGGSSSCSTGSVQQHSNVCTSKGQYTLHGVVIHSGYTANSGHYYAYVRDWEDKWHCMNDSTVYRVSEATVLKQQVYMLFYVRSSIKRMAQLPKHMEAQPGQPAAAAAAAAGIKRSISSSTAGAATAEPAQCMIGPQLPPHLAKRQRLSQDASDTRRQQQQQHGAAAAAAAAAGGDEPVDMFAADRVLGPQLPPGWHQCSSSNGGSAPVTAGAEQQQQQQQQQQLGGLSGAQGQQSKPAIAAATAHGSNAGRAYFNWARQDQQQHKLPVQQQEQQQQYVQHQRQEQSVADAAEQLLSCARPEIQSDVEQQMSSCQYELRSWLLGLLSAAKSSGKSYEQFEKETKPLWRQHPLLHTLGLELMTKWHSKLLGWGDAGAGVEENTAKQHC